MTTEDQGDYFAQMERLAHAQVEYDQECQRIRRDHFGRIESSDTRVRQANIEIVAAQKQLVQARTFADQADLEADNTWQTVLFLAPGRVASRAGPMPEPVHVNLDTSLRTGQTPSAAVTALLSDVQRRAERIRAGRSPAFGDYLGLATLGVIGAVIGFSAARGLMMFGGQTGGSAGLVCSSVGRIATILSPLIGLTGVRWFLNRRAVDFGLGILLAVVASGIVAATVAFVLWPIVVG